MNSCNCTAQKQCSVTCARDDEREYNNYTTIAPHTHTLITRAADEQTCVCTSLCIHGHGACMFSHRVLALNMLLSYACNAVRGTLNYVMTYEERLRVCVCVNKLVCRVVCVSKCSVYVNTLPHTAQK